MNAAETSASSAMVDWTPLTVVSRSFTTAEIDTFMMDVSTTSTNMAIASRMASRGLLSCSPSTATDTSELIATPFWSACHHVRAGERRRLHRTFNPTFLIVYHSCRCSMVQNRPGSAHIETTCIAGGAEH